MRDSIALTSASAWSNRKCSLLIADEPGDDIQSCSRYDPKDAGVLAVRLTRSHLVERVELQVRIGKKDA